MEVIEILLRELKVERIILAKEMDEKSIQTKQELLKLIEKMNGPVEVVTVPHKEFKEMSKNVKGIIRTGADIPYSNVILVGGVIF